MTPPTATIALVAVGAVVAGCETAATDRRHEIPVAPSGRLAVGAGAVRAPYASGRELVLPGSTPTRLGGEVNALFSTLVPGAVPDHGADPSAIAYSSFQGAAPVIRLHELATGKDVILDDGAYSVAWKADGAVAYFRVPGRRIADPERHRGDVVVRASPEAAPERWSPAPSRYVVAAWAGARLLAHERRAVWPDLLVFDGPGKVRTLAEGAALVAVSPDGRHALVTVRPDPAPAVRIVRIDDGREVATFRFDERREGGGHAVTYVSDSGSWAPDGRVVTAVSEGFAVLRLGADSIRLEQLLWLDPRRFPVGGSEARADPSGRRFASVVQLPEKPGAAVPTAAILECDRLALRCSMTAPLPSLPPPRLIYNPSRP